MTQEITGVMVGPGKNFPWGELRFIETATEKIRAFGKNLPTIPGLFYTMAGHFETSPKYGEQFIVESWSASSYSRAEILRILKEIPGVGEKTAQAVYSTFGEDTLMVIRNQPERLDEVAAPRKALDTIRASFSEHARLSRLYKLLIPYGFTSQMCVFLNSQFGDRTELLLKNEPYSLCDYPDFSFPVVDALAVGEGYPLNDSIRVEAGIRFLLKEHESTGDTSMLASDVYVQLPALLKIKSADIFEVVKVSGQISSLKLEKKMRYARTVTLRAERAIAKYSKEISRQICLSPEQEANLLNYMKSSGITLESDQAKALFMAATETFCCITGGPGTGKTTLIKHIATWMKEYEKIPCLCLAPTGMAARRLREASGFPASTIHSALGISDEVHKAVDLSGHCVVIDEASMMDVFLASKLLSSGPARVILVGDAAQLGSVGPGAVFRDILYSSYLPSMVLKQVYRYSDNSRCIIENARLIQEGNTNILQGEGFRTCYGLTETDLEKKMLSLYLEGVEKYGLDNVCLIVPVKDGPSGVKNLNKLAQSLLNPPSPAKPEIMSGRTVFRLGDRVMETRNSGPIVNGDVGYITEIKNQKVKIEYLSGETGTYPSGELHHITHAYAVTVHKAQGSEYEMVITCLQDQNRTMTRRSIVYTALTRAKSEAIYCGSQTALEKAIENNDKESRKTFLPEAIAYKFTHREKTIVMSSS